MNWLRGCIQFLSSKSVISLLQNTASVEKTVDRILEMFLDWDLRETSCPQNGSLLIPDLHVLPKPIKRY